MTSLAQRTGRNDAAERATGQAAGQPVRGWGLGALVGMVLFAGYTWFALARHRQLLTTGFDLGIFGQEVRSYAEWQWPTSSIKGPGFPLLGDHFSPAMAVLAPFYRLVPSVETLLVAQALLVALGAVPLVAWARRTVGAGAVVAVGAAYGLSWGVAEAVGFDVHEVMLAVPLLAFSAVALGEHRWRAGVLWALPLVLVKEDLGLTLAAVGLLVAWGGRRRLGWCTAAFGMLATVVATYVVIPAVSADHVGAYAGQIHWGWTTPAHLFWPGPKVLTLLTLLAPTAFLALRSRLVLLAVPTVAWRFLADNPGYWGTAFHYSLVLMPMLFAAMVDALRRVRSPRPWVAASLLFTLAWLPGHLFGSSLSLLRGSAGTLDTDAVTRLLDRIPDGVAVSAGNGLAPQLVDRTDVSLFGMTPLRVSCAAYAVVDTAPATERPVTPAQLEGALIDARRSGYRVIGRADSVVLLQRGASCVPTP